MSVTFRQYEGAWANDPYPYGNDNMANSGCGPTSIANVLANSILPNITPSETGKYMNSKGYAIANAGSTWAGMTETLRHYGVECTYLSYPSPSTVWEHMNKGNRYIIILFGGGTQGGITWTAGGHYVAATGYKIENNKHWFYTRDSGGRKNDGWHCFEDTMSSLACAFWVCTSSAQAAKFKGDSTEGSYSGNAVDNGQSIVLEQQIAKLYSSSNYEFIKQEEKQSEVSENLISIVKTALSALKPPLTEVSANDVLNAGGVVPRTTLQDAINDLVVKSYKTSKTLQPKKKIIKRGNLLSNENVIEAPIIVLNLNGVTIGGYGNLGDVYPNYISSLTINKINGRINQYTINLVYTVRYGEDPNFIDKLLSMTGFTNKISILYGDSNGKVIFRDDEALITDVSFNESITNKTISYTITALSSIISASSVTSNYASKQAKPSTLINDLFYSTTPQSRALLSALPGMRAKTLVNSRGLIPTNDEQIITQTRVNSSPISQLSYYVSGMYNEQNNSTYSLLYMDDTRNEFGGPYIKINEIKTTTTEVLSGNYFEIDIGYPGNNFVMGFSLNNDVYFPLIYKYNNKFSSWNYDIDNMGNVIRTKSNPLLLNNDFNKKNVIQSNWWNKVTEYPVSAQLTVKGLMKPVMLGSFIKVNVLFYGSQDLASGLYMIVGQTDSISGSGYVTTLSLLRVGKQ